MYYEYAWSWNTAAAITASIVLYYLLRYMLKRKYIEDNESLKREAAELFLQPPLFWDNEHIDRMSVCYSKALNRWLWSFRYLSSGSLGLKLLCVAIQIAVVVTFYYGFTEPIYFESYSP